VVDPQFAQRYQAPLRTMMAPQSEQLGASSLCTAPASPGRTAAEGPAAAWVNWFANPAAFSISVPFREATLASSCGWASLGRNLYASQRKM